jgi:hypothetical protein
MSACPEWNDKLIDYVLGVEADIELQSHLLHCSSCAAAAAVLSERTAEIDRTVEVLVSQEPPASLANKVMAGIHAQHDSHKVWKPAVVLSMVIVIAAVAILFYRRGSIEQAIPESTSTLVDWRSPTDSLLHATSQPLLTEMPRLGEMYYSIQTNGEKNAR